MHIRRLSRLCGIGLIGLSLAGCGDPNPTNVMENADAQALKDYERMLVEDGLMQDEESPDKQVPQ